MVETVNSSLSTGPAPPYSPPLEFNSEVPKPHDQAHDSSAIPALENNQNPNFESEMSKSTVPTNGPYAHTPVQNSYNPYEMKDVLDSVPPQQNSSYDPLSAGRVQQSQSTLTNSKYYTPAQGRGAAQDHSAHYSLPKNSTYHSPGPGQSSSSKKGTGLLSMLGGSSKKSIEDVYIAVMGVTGAGKSSFISLCTKQSIVIGHNLESCTMEVEDFSFMWNDHIRIHLIDTPGFDDTKRKDTDVLRDIAGWMAVTYKKKIKLSGIIYLHRITDPRMGGTQMRNLTMFKELCGPKCFPAVTLVTTFWGTVDPAIGADREKQLRSNDEFWGYMAKKGSRIVRHSGSRESAMDIVDSIVKRQKTIVLDIQDDMVNKGLDLDETLAGQSLNRELIEQGKKHKQEMKILEADMRKAIAEKDEESVEVIAQMQREFQDKINQGNKDVQDLQASLDNLKEERDREFKQIQDTLKERAEEYARREQEWNDFRDSNPYDPAENERRETEMEGLRSQLKDLIEKGERKKAGVWDQVGEFFDEVVEDVKKWWKDL